MPKIGDRYVIEIDDVFISKIDHKEAGVYLDTPLYRIKGFNSLVFDQNGIDKLLKYDDCIKIDLAKAEKRGYEKGLAESKEEDEIKVGDEVTFTLYSNHEIDKLCGIKIGVTCRDEHIILGSDYHTYTLCKEALHKTGRTYPIAEIMEKFNE